MLIQLSNVFERNDLSDTSNRLLASFNCDQSATVTRMTYANDIDSQESIEDTFAKFTTFLYDCDGLLGSDADKDQEYIADAIKLIDSLRRKNKKLIFTSNRSDKSRQQMLLRIKSLGINATVDEMFPTSYSTAVYLKAIDFQREVFVVGSEGIHEELNAVGIRSTVFLPGECPHSTPKDMDPGFASFKLNPNVGAVVLSLDNHIPLPHLVKACSYATKPDCLFIVANPDETEDTVPDSQVAAIQVAANKGFISLGKPHKFYYHCIRQKHPNIDTKRTLIITDRLQSDIVFGRNTGIQSVFVESKTYFNEYSIKSIDRHCIPDFVANSLGSLADVL